MVLCIVLIDLIFIGPLGAFEGGWIHATLIEKREPPSSVEKGVRSLLCLYVIKSSNQLIVIICINQFKSMLKTLKSINRTCAVFFHVVR